MEQRSIFKSYLVDVILTVIVGNYQITYLVQNVINSGKSTFCAPGKKFLSNHLQTRTHQLSSQNNDKNVKKWNNFNNTMLSTFNKKYFNGFTSKQGRK